MSDLLSTQLDQLADDHFRLMGLLGKLLPAVDYYLESNEDPDTLKAREAVNAYLHYYYGDFS